MTMHVGLNLVFQNPENARPDSHVYRDELAMALKAEHMGFDSVWTVEHHFTDYTMSPDPLTFLSWIAGQTSRIRLGTDVLVLPWHDPMRLAEQIALVDNLSGGRLILGIGRGLARVEYDGFRLDMNVSRQHFTESAEAILQGLEQGFVEYNGEIVKQPRRDIRPRPERSFRGRTYAAAVSPDSMPVMAKLGVGVLVIPQKPWADVRNDFDVYREVYLAENGVDAPPPLCGGFVVVDNDAKKAEDLAHEYIGQYYGTVIKHYELDQSPHAGVKGYEFYDKTAKYIKRHGATGASESFVELSPYGTPAQVLEKFEFIRETLGPCGFMPAFSFAGMPYEQADKSMSLFVEKVMPTLRTWASEGVPQGAERALTSSR